MSRLLHFVPKIPKTGRNHFGCIPSMKNRPHFTGNALHWGDIQVIWYFLHMPKQGTEIAHHANTVGFFPVAPLA